MPTALYSLDAISPNFSINFESLVAANPSCDGHLENPLMEKAAIPPPFTSWSGSELIESGIPNLPFEATRCK